MKRTTMTASSREWCFTDLISFNPTTPCHVRSTASVLYAGCLGLRKAVALLGLGFRRSDLTTLLLSTGP